MNTATPAPLMDGAASSNIRLIKILTFFMFLMFAMTTDAVGVIIPKVIEEFGLGHTAGGAFHYATMTGIALGGAGLGFLADRIGHKRAIMIGLGAFAFTAFLFAAGNDFAWFLLLLFISGLSIGLFKSAALALIGDITRSTRDHTATMNMVEGFFGVGAIIGPAIVAILFASGASWKWLYVIAGVLCCVLILMAQMARYPAASRADRPGVDLRASIAAAVNPYVFVFSAGVMLYVGVETAIYVWMPTLLKDYAGSATILAAYALPVFFVLRAAGRFLGFWLLGRMRWTTVLLAAGFAIFACFLAAVLGGRAVAVYSLPLSGLFMSVVYPTLNSKGISCLPKPHHGAAAGAILFYTALAAVLAPLAMGAVSDLFGDAEYGFILATGFAGVLLLGLIWNAVADPSAKVLRAREAADYA